MKRTAESPLSAGDRSSRRPSVPVVLLALACSACLVSGTEGNECPDSGARYIPAGVQVESAAECDPSACPYYCYYTTCGSDAPGIWCEECDALEAFLDGACADCTIDLREGAIWANCGGAK